jgi:hypothetical protein
MTTISKGMAAPTKGCSRCQCAACTGRAVVISIFRVHRACALGHLCINCQHAAQILVYPALNINIGSSSCSNSTFRSAPCVPREIGLLGVRLRADRHIYSPAAIDMAPARRPAIPRSNCALRPLR